MRPDPYCPEVMNETGNRHSIPGSPGGFCFYAAASFSISISNRRAMSAGGLKCGLSRNDSTGYCPIAGRPRFWYYGRLSANKRNRPVRAAAGGTLMRRASLSELPVPGQRRGKLRDRAIGDPPQAVLAQRPEMVRAAAIASEA